MYWFKNMDFTGIDWAVPVPVKVDKRREPDGMSCKRCKDFYHMAEANQDDGSLVCYLCRNNPYR